MWEAARKENNLPTANRSTYYEIFYRKFNLAFGSPRSDICSTCKTLTHNTTVGSSDDKNEAAMRLKLHKLKAKKFYMELKEARLRCDTLAVTFDLQQTQPLPRTNVTEAFYKRQMWLYNLAIVVHCRDQSQKNVFMYSWTENERGRGSNEICSALRDFLKRIKKRVILRRYSILHLFSDSCAGQNKNVAMIAALLTYVNSSDMAFKTVRYTFPIRGHSYMPPDRLFGRIEKDVRKKEEILAPAGYHDIFRKHGTLRLYGKDFHVFDYKALAASLFVGTGKLHMRENRVWKFEKNSNFISVGNSYFGALQQVNILKKTVPTLHNRRAKRLLPESHISILKARDMNELLNLLSIPEDVKAFYAAALKPTSARDSLEYPKIVSRL